MVHRSETVHIHWHSEKLSTDSISEKPVLPSIVLPFTSFPLASATLGRFAISQIFDVASILLQPGGFFSPGENSLLYFFRTFIILYINVLQGFISIFG